MEELSYFKMDNEELEIVDEAARKNINENADKIDSTKTALEAQIQAVNTTTRANLTAHTSNKSNPHNVTKAQVGLDNVDNTSDIDKPISRATQNALNELDSKITGGGGGESNITDTATGENITVTNSADAPVRSLKVDSKTEQFTTKGYQLFYASKAFSKTQGGATLTNNGDGSFTISGSGVLTEHFNGIAYTYTHEETLKILKAGYIKLSGVPESATATVPYIYMRISVNGSSVASIYRGDTTTGVEITQEMLDNETCVLQIGYWGNSGSEIKTGTFKPMFYQDGDGTWEPYTGGNPSPNPDYLQNIEGVDDLEVTVTGKNLLGGFETKTVSAVTFTVNDDGSVTANGTATADGFIKIYVTLTAGKYILSGCPSNGSTARYSLELYCNSKWFYDYGNGLNFTLNEETSCSVAVLVRKGQTVNNLTFYPMIRKAEIADNTYEPYKSQTITLSDVPTLYEGDSVTLKNGKLEVYRENKKVVFDGSEDWVYNNTDLTTARFAIQTNISNEGVVCNAFRSVDTIAEAYNNGSGIKAYASGYLDIVYPEITTLEEWKTWLSENPIEVVYKSTEPITEVIETDIDLSTYCNVTHITNSENANMEVEYFVDSANGEVVADLQKQLHDKAPITNPKFEGYMTVKGDIVASGEIFAKTPQGDTVSLYDLKDYIVTQTYHDTETVGAGSDCNCGFLVSGLNKLNGYKPISVKIYNTNGMPVVCVYSVINPSGEDFYINYKLFNFGTVSYTATMALEVLYVRDI